MLSPLSYKGKTSFILERFASQVFVMCQRSLCQVCQIECCRSCDHNHLRSHVVLGDIQDSSVLERPRRVSDLNLSGQVCKGLSVVDHV